MSDYLEKDGTVVMTGDLNVGNNKIKNLSNPTENNEAANKDYVDKLVNHNAVQPSHYKDEFSYLMSSAAQWTDEIDGGNSYTIKKIADLNPHKGNFHTYKHKVIYLGINKNSNGFKYKMGINFYRLEGNKDYTLCIELLNTDKKLWDISQISVDKGTSTGLTDLNVNVRKLSFSYTDSKNRKQNMYYHRIIVNFRKLLISNKFFLHILVNIPNLGNDLASYPTQFLGCYIITYGIMGKFNNIDPDKVYDYHTSFDILPTEVKYNVDINTNNKKILNIDLDRSSNNSAATVGMVKEIIPFIKNNVYRKYFEVFDFTDSDSYGVNIQSSDVTFDSISSNSDSNVSFPNKTIDNIRKDGLNVNGFTITLTPTSGQTSYTLCFIFIIWRNRNFSIVKKDSNNNQILFNLFYLNSNNTLHLNIRNVRKNITIPSSFNGKKIILWVGENINSSTTKVNISDYSSELVANLSHYSSNQKFEFLNQDGVLEKI